MCVESATPRGNRLDERDVVHQRRPRQQRALQVLQVRVIASVPYRVVPKILDVFRTSGDRLGAQPTNL